MQIVKILNRKKIKVSVLVDSVSEFGNVGVENAEVAEE